MTSKMIENARAELVSRNAHSKPMTCACDLFRHQDSYCDVFKEGGHFLYACCEVFARPHFFACKEYMPTCDGYRVSAYAGADYEYLSTLEYAPVDIALDIIASEDRYTLECMARDADGKF